MQDSDKILSRLIDILKKLSSNEKPKVIELAQHFNVTQRTIQRDLYQRLLCFPIEKNSQGELQFINGFSIEQSFLDDDEMLFTYLTLSKVKDDNPHFKEKIQQILKKLLKPQHNPIHNDEYNLKSTTTKNEFMEIIENAIFNNNILIVEFEKESIEIKPHRIINNKTSSILLAHDISDQKIKVIHLSTVKNIHKQKRKFRTKKSLDETLNNVHSAFFNAHHSKEFEVFVHEDIAAHFIENKVLPSQKILSKNLDGSIMIKFSVENDCEVETIVKEWMPYLKITKPLAYNKIILSKMQQYIEICSQ